MSCYDWEKGVFVIPSAEWARVKSSIRDAMNKQNEARYRLGVRLYDELKKTKPPSHNHQLPGQILQKLAPGLDDETVWAITSHVSVWKSNGKKTTLGARKPTKRDFPRYTNTATLIEGDNCRVIFDNTTRELKWVVHENNRAVESARRSPLGQAVFKTLKSVRWTRGSGGQIIGNDEYNTDSQYEGGGANYAKESFGPDSSGKEAASTASFRYRRY